MPVSITNELFLTSTEVAKYLRISKATVYRLIHGKELEAVRVGRSFRVSVASADAYLRKQSTMKSGEEI